MRNISNRVQRLELQTGISDNDEVICIGNGSTDMDSLVKAKVNNQELLRNDGETWEQFEKRVEGIAGQTTSYYYKGGRKFLSMMCIKVDLPKSKKSRGQYAY